MNEIMTHPTVRLALSEYVQSLGTVPWVSLEIPVNGRLESLFVRTGRVQLGDLPRALRTEVNKGIPESADVLIAFEMKTIDMVELDPPRGAAIAFILRWVSGDVTKYKIYQLLDERSDTFWSEQIRNFKNTDAVKLFETVEPHDVCDGGSARGGNA